jgi:nicotinate phosphoribosyltransferase
MNLEEKYAKLLTGSEDAPSPLLTDGYKFSMGQAGAPLRQETFCLTFRHGDPLLVPFDFEEVIDRIRPRMPDTKELGFLAANGYSMSSAMEKALQADLEVWAAPKGSWVMPGEPVLTITGPSFLVSWLEPLVIAFHFPMQVATALRRNERYDSPLKLKATCEDEAEILRLVSTAVFHVPVCVDVTVDTEGYLTSIVERVVGIRAALNGDIGRAFEVGTRAMTCLDQHRICLKTLKGLGIEKTANVLLAYELYMIPVGTTGHEHQQRWLSDADGFRAIRDMRPEPPSYLFDTYNAIRSGIPTAQRVMAEDPDRRCSVRFDSGDQEEQLRLFMEGSLKPSLFIFMDGYDAARTGMMEGLCQQYGIPTEARIYGFGSYLVTPDFQQFSRNKVAAVYKLTMSGPNPVMKFAGGKSSIPGKPVVLRRGTESVVAQQGEAVRGFEPLTPRYDPPTSTTFSPATCELIEVCKDRLDSNLSA